jgi:outer membrane protein OmpA-like peptidoglycan-associated protein
MRATYQKAQEAWQQRNMEQALLLYEQVLTAAPNLLEAHLRLGQIYTLSNNKERTRYHYTQATSLEPGSRELAPAYQWLGREALAIGGYAEALDYFQKALPLYPERSTLARITERHIQTCRFGIEAVQKPSPITKKSLGDTVNFLKAQFFPVLTADNETLLFTGLTNEQDEDIYITTRSHGYWIPPTPLSSRINTPQNEGTCSISADGRVLVFTACNRRDGFGSCDLYISFRQSGDWTTPQNMGDGINSRFWDSQPTLSADGRTLYFASDRPGGLGKSDLWRSDLTNDGAWTLPINLGAPINTPEDENAPFIHPNGQTLFFASNGHVGLGGLDLFVAERRDSSWTAPLNLGYPINTHSDQVALFVSADGKDAYYTEDKSTRSGRQSELYSFEIPQALKSKILPTSFIKGTVSDAQSGQPLAATIELHDLATKQQISQFSSEASTGTYMAILNQGGDYALYVTSKGYLFKSEHFQLTDTTESLRVDIRMEAIQKNRAEVLNNLYFDTGSYTLNEKSKVELEKLVLFLNENPQLRIEVAGHTDDLGNDASNLLLSKQRANTVVAFLIERGIETSRLQAVGYGKQQPKVPNSSEQNRAINRRIEWVVR